VGAFREGAFVESDYLHHLVRTIRSIGEGGSAVLLGVDPDDPTLYDLVVNTARVGHAGACEAVLSAYRGRFGAEMQSDRRSTV
jgi:hypothetical protein